MVVDDDVNIRDWKDVIWAITTRVDPTRDTLLADSTPIDYLDFASPVSGLGSKMGIDTTHKWPGATSREWGRPMKTTPEVTARVDQVWQRLDLQAKRAEACVSSGHPDHTHKRTIPRPHLPFATAQSVWPPCTG